MSHLFALDRSAFLHARCGLCLRPGPAAALDEPLDALHEAGRLHLDQAHPGAPLTAVEVEPGRPMGGWDGTEPPHEWMNRHFPSLW
ncbi:hypothetical protein ACIGQE_27510 [Streptomyces sp. NPDC053429]|uniref:hypothetical protein n=1 Tax=Streptomyces sp. NPDC053429 TaxID=3365702 RepID=UPI0037D2E077